MTILNPPLQNFRGQSIFEASEKKNRESLTQSLPRLHTILIKTYSAKNIHIIFFGMKQYLVVGYNKEEKDIDSRAA